MPDEIDKTDEEHVASLMQPPEEPEAPQAEPETDQPEAEPEAPESDEEPAEGTDEPEAPAEDDPLAFLADLDGQAPQAVQPPAVTAPPVNDAEVKRLNEELANIRRELLMSNGVQPPDAELINPASPKYDPVTYNGQLFKWQQHQQTRQQAEQQQQVEERRQAETFVATRDAELAKDMPFLFQGENGKKAATAILEEAVRNGVPRDQAWALTAPMVKTFYHSLRWQAAENARKRAETQQTARKASPKPVRATGAKPDAGAAALAKLSASGSEEDAVRYLMSPKG